MVVFANSTNVLSLTFGGLTANKEYTGYKLEVEFMDGTKETKEVSFKTTIDYGQYKELTSKELSSSIRVILTPSDIKAHLFSKINVYVNGELKTTIEPDAKYVALEKGWITGTEKVELKGVVSSDSSEVLVGTYQFGAVETPKPELTVETEKLVITEGESGEIKASATENGKVVYTSSDAAIATVDAKGKVTALKAGEVTITVTVEGTEEKKEVKVTVLEKVEEHVHEFKEGKCECGEEDPNYVAPHEHKFVEGKCECGETDPNYQAPQDPEPQPEPAGGCKSGAIQSVFYLLSVFGLAFVLRKKRF